MTTKTSLKTGLPCLPNTAIYNVCRLVKYVVEQSRKNSLNHL